MIENIPEKSKYSTIIDILLNSDYMSKINKINDEYLYWDKVKYQSPKDVNPIDFWNAVKYTRQIGKRDCRFFTCNLFFHETNKMQESLHNFDINFGCTLASSSILNEKNRQYYLLSSIMEEAIASSQMEGASTTRIVAKDMLRKQAKPKDKSQQMILNNYNTIRYLSEHKDDDFSPELLLEIHRQITEKTLDDPNDEGRFRTDNNIYVVNGITGEVAHDPPSFSSISKTINELCSFINQDLTFIHPIIKAIVLHFMISYLHPFVDGNGRTARSLFYWYMLKKGYWLTEYLSISRIIYKSKGQYEKAFLYTEHDEFDLGYFITYNLKVLNQAFDELKNYLGRKEQEQKQLFNFMILGLNERQTQIVKMCSDKPDTVFISKELVSRFNVSVKTIRTDLDKLVEMGLMSEVQLNKRLTGYTRSKDFDSRVKEIRGN